MVLLPRFDLVNGRETVFCDWKANELCKVRGAGYDLLELIDLNTEIDVENIPEEACRYLNYFIDKGIVQTYE